MESTTMDNHKDQPTNSLEEVDPHEPDVVPGTRSYECVFCKRGFTTAQAFGGHMNIHRKDRAKNRPTCNLSDNNNSNKQEDHSFYSNPKFYHPFFFASYETPNYNQEGKYFSTMSSTAHHGNHENIHQDCHEDVKNSSRYEKMMSLSLQFGWSHEEADHIESKTRSTHEDDDDDDDDDNNDDDLDLELRLGHDP